MTEKKKHVEQKLLACKIIWYACGVAATLGFLFFVVCPVIGAIYQLMGFYALAAARGMLLVWWTYFVVLVLMAILEILLEGVIAMIFFSKLKEAAFESIEDLLKGKGLALSR
ncbi:hypothetical protein IKW75_01830 [Candidatus Saccharibacteria bacterium]|nr:hypothetical protein [Candidatus Saccharibacteria bacterium]